MPFRLAAVVPPHPGCNIIDLPLLHPAKCHMLCSKFVIKLPKSHLRQFRYKISRYLQSITMNKYAFGSPAVAAFTPPASSASRHCPCRASGRAFQVCQSPRKRRVTQASSDPDKIQRFLLASAVYPPFSPYDTRRRTLPRSGKTVGSAENAAGRVLHAAISCSTAYDDLFRPSAFASKDLNAAQHQGRNIATRYYAQYVVSAFASC